MPGIPGNQRNYSLGTITKNTNSHCMATHNTENQGDGNIQKSYILFCQMKKIQIKCQITLYEKKKKMYSSFGDHNDILVFKIQFKLKNKTLGF